MSSFLKPAHSFGVPRRSWLEGKARGSEGEDVAPKGRDEDPLEFKQAWVRHHDRYED